MKKLKIILIAVAVLCAGFFGVIYYLTPKGVKYVNVEGELVGVPDGLIVKLVWSSNGKRCEAIDTVKNGHFSFYCDGFKGKIKNLLLGTLNATNGTTKGITLYKSKEIKITGQGENIFSWKVDSDNPKQPFYNKMNNLVADEYAQMEKQKVALSAAAQTGKDSIQSIIDSMQIAVAAKKLDEMMNLPINELWEYELRDISTMLVDDANHPLREKVAEAYALMPDKHNRKSVGIDILENLQSVGIGGIYIDIPLADKNDEQHNLSEFVGEKWLLLDFSDFYCGYCHAICPSLKYFIQTYSDNIQLVTISNDNKKDFAKMVEEDEISWPAFFNQDAYSKYSISGRPTFILISPEGRVVDRCLGANYNWLLKTFSKHSENVKPQIEQSNGITTITHPAIEGDINGFTINRIDLYADSTVVSFVSMSFGSYSIGSGSTLRCSDGSVCKAVSSSIGFDNFVDRKKNMIVKVTFEPLPTGVNSFDYIEGDCDNCFSVNGVKVAGY